MQKERWQKIEEIFFAAAEFHGPARENFLRDNCLGDEAMLSEIRALLAESARRRHSETVRRCVSRCASR